jgi:hypothetical protein
LRRPVDKDTRNAIERATQRARRLLEDDFVSQLEGTFDVLRSGEVAATGGSHLTPRQRVVQEKIVAAVEHKRAVGAKPREAVAGYARDAAFTALNRFVALKMLEARGLLQECVTKGELSSGYKEYCGLASGVALLPDGAGYRLYVECLFDELSTEIKVLFDRRDPASVLWPKRATFEELLALLNAPELAGVWGEDETIGWVYQFFNSREERQALRDPKAGGSQAPRNSYELAVRNQFFTPLYVVRFLTENTLGRTWIEMMGEKTRLAERCDFLVTGVESRGPRAKKDPRDIRILDPACGSGHFLLYAFDLLLPIYEEAWADLEAAPLAATGRKLAQDYPDLDALRRAVPGLILGENLHGVDIDPRCAQIAALALWLRAQRAYRESGVAPSERPRITRTHIVVAEPMPGDAALVEAFAADLQPPLLGNLFRKMVAEMRLAGELGSLIRVDKGIGEELERARQQWNREREPGDLLPGLDEYRVQSELDLAYIDNSRFFEDAEALLLAALRTFAESAVGAAGVRRRLFTGDAVLGIALIDLLRTKFDVALMNPPFGALPERAAVEMQSLLSEFGDNLYTLFFHRAEELAPDGRVGMISSRSYIAYRDYAKFREKLLLSAPGAIELLADLGWEVLDGAQVETAALVTAAAPNQNPKLAIYLRLLDVPPEQKEAVLLDPSPERVYSRYAAHFAALPGSPLCYWASESLVRRLADAPKLFPDYAYAGLGASPHSFFFRLAWEVPPMALGKERTWRRIARGGEYSPFYRDNSLVINWWMDGYAVKQYISDLYPYLNGNYGWKIQDEEYYGLPGITYGKRNERFNVQALPAGLIFTDEGQGIIPNRIHDLWFLLGYLNSSVVAYFLSLTSGLQKHYVYIRPIPIVVSDPVVQERIGQLARRAFQIKHFWASRMEESEGFLTPIAIAGTSQSLLSSKGAIQRLFDDTSELKDIRNEVSSLSEQALAAAPLELQEIRAVFAALPEDRPAPFLSDLDDVQRRVEIALRFVSFSVGVAFGRFDVRIATGERALPPAPDALDPLPVCSPGMLTGDDGLPLSVPPPGYPLAFRADGILVDDPGDPRDLTAAVRAVFEVVFGAEADTRWNEAAELLDPKGQDLRAWLSGSFFEHHLKRYSKSRRKAPILWQLATPSGRYSVWLYAHRVTSDTLFHVQNEVLALKLGHEERRLAGLVADGGPNPSSAARKEIDRQETFVGELRALRDEVARVAPLWRPDLNDGVLLTMAPLWRLVPQHRAWQKELRSAWDALASGKYDWAHLAMHLWPERVVPRCASDRSLAIAHVLEPVFWVEGSDGKWTARANPRRPLDELLRERSSMAVKAALQSLVEAPAAQGETKPKRAKGAR